jgi:hypothetical protein
VSSAAEDCVNELHLALTLLTANYCMAFGLFVVVFCPIFTPMLCWFVYRGCALLDRNCGAACNITDRHVSEARDNNNNNNTAADSQYRTAWELPETQAERVEKEANPEKCHKNNQRTIDWHSELRTLPPSENRTTQISCGDTVLQWSHRFQRVVDWTDNTGADVTEQSHAAWCRSEWKRIATRELRK